MTRSINDPAAPASGPSAANPADIAWMRNLAEEGGRAPMRGASILMSAGLIYGAASLINWAAIVDLLPITGGQIGFIWIGATLAFFAALFLGLRNMRKDGVKTAANRASGVVWSGLGWGIFTLFLSLMALSFRLETQALVVFSLIPSIIMVFYGVGWAVSAAMHRSRPLWALSIGSFAAAPILALFAGQAAQYLAYAAALFLLMALPGVLLMRVAGRD